MLRGNDWKELLGIGNLFDKGALCLIEAEFDTKRSNIANSLLGTGKAHLEIGIPEIGGFLKLFFNYPEEVKVFFNPSCIIFKMLLHKF